MPFELANRYSHKHLIVQPVDLWLSPPESYLCVQDGLIISCGVLYSLCYLFYMRKIYQDKTFPGILEYLCPNMAYEIYYAFVTTSTRFERFSFLTWFLLDVSFAAVAVTSLYPYGGRGMITGKLFIGALVGIGFLYTLCRYFPDDREQVTAYWTGILLQLPVGWGSIYLLLKRGDTKGQSLEIWITRYLGCFTAYGVFFWRYLNAPQNWSYVGSFWSIAIIVITLIPETAYPFVYAYVNHKEKVKTV
ncbi:hypothetical protein K469DRAFT_589944 [Zopfia rhizophila CBS 207.26]|uniref:Uncharacterized protein n=1 Tax=Zopfia rhizophila CBS 207.26 TaxID=1314779 RepID=A0A6A6DSD8_9PEZI|nr:hypothetical protein K469DRAFT_589944 [Zopfia rhizophila CBS 207.26]